jgi:hypothetical protein
MTTEGMGEGGAARRMRAKIETRAIYAQSQM